MLYFTGLSGEHDYVVASVALRGADQIADLDVRVDTVRKFSQRLPWFHVLFFICLAALAVLVIIATVLFEESEVELVAFIHFRRRSLAVFLRRPPVLCVADVATFITGATLVVQDVLVFTEEQKFGLR